MAPYKSFEYTVLQYKIMARLAIHQYFVHNVDTVFTTTVCLLYSLHTSLFIGNDTIPFLI